MDKNKAIKILEKTANHLKKAKHSVLSHDLLCIKHFIENTEANQVDTVLDQPEAVLGGHLAKLLNNGWEIEPCGCSCGGNYVWMEPRPSGAHMPWGCVCHNGLPNYE